ncbi:uncharacterized protein LOC117111350, partial [Anneissia japonica]|uniref:uncharacterized protein LOC117111350 n=1 Tax=Anneissia japonica TaxID=1529436 RepID=UPI00142574F4
MFYLPRSFQAVVAESPMFATTDYGGKILISNFHLGTDPLLFQLQFVVTSDNNIFQEKSSLKSFIFMSTVYNQTYFAGSDFEEDHLFETLNLIRIEVINNSSDPYIPVGWDKGCTSPVALGMESGYIEDCQITSSEAPDEAAPAHNARLNMPNT